MLKRACKFVLRSSEVLGLGKVMSVGEHSCKKGSKEWDDQGIGNLWGLFGRDSSRSAGHGWVGLSTMMAYSWLRTMFGNGQSSKRPGEGSKSGWFKRSGFGGSVESAEACLEVGGDEAAGASLSWSWAWLSGSEEWWGGFAAAVTVQEEVALTRNKILIVIGSNAEFLLGWLQHSHLNVTIQCS